MDTFFLFCVFFSYFYFFAVQHYYISCSRVHESEFYLSDSFLFFLLLFLGTFFMGVMGGGSLLIWEKERKRYYSFGVGMISIELYSGINHGWNGMKGRTKIGMNG